MNAIVHSHLQQMSPADFASFGVNEIAYIKPVQQAGEPAYAVHAADGTALTVTDSREVAAALCRQNDMEPLSLH